MVKKRAGNGSRIRRNFFYGITGCLMLLVAAAFYKNEIYESWIHSSGREYVMFTGLESKLKEIQQCYLCGSGDDGKIDCDSIGLISLNDWYVLDSRITESGGKQCAGLLYGNTEEMAYHLASIPARGMASMEITLPESFKLDIEMIQNHLCQRCLDKVAESLEYSKWSREEKEAVPLCLVDFQTKEIYSLQDWHRGCMIRDYWVQIQSENKKIFVDIFYVPDRSAAD